MNILNIDRLHITELVLAVHVPNGQGTPIHNDRPSHGIALHLAGKKHYQFSDGKIFPIENGDLIFLPKGSSYIVDAETNGECYAINFNVESDESMTPFSLSVKNLPQLAEWFRRAEIAWRKKETGYYETCLSLLYSILSELKKQRFAGYVPVNAMVLLAKATDYIADHYTKEPIRIPDLAALCGVSEVYLRRLFHTVHGVSPIQYVNDLKIERARELIASGFYSMTEIAVLSGFNDYAYFSREFKKKVGTSPTEYAQRLEK